MATYILKINEKSSLAKSILAFIMDLASKNKDIELQREPNALTKKAIIEAKEGKGKVYKNANDFFNSL